MIEKKQVRNLYYVDRDTDIGKLVEKINKNRVDEIVAFLNEKKNNLQSKEAGEYITIEDILKMKDGELENMQRFFRGAVVPYYARQSRDVWSEKIPAPIIKDCVDEIKKEVGFIIYDHTGHPTDEVNSMTTFKYVKDLNQFLKDVEENIFGEQYIYPDSERFKELEKTKGRNVARIQIIEELKIKMKNRGIDV